ncbi:MAG: hypothetical protein CO182_04130, partial [Lysobacterales bacterium CG_4_9_14_3_um_filter_62_6]
MRPGADRLRGLGAVLVKGFRIRDAARLSALRGVAMFKIVSAGGIGLGLLLCAIDGQAATNPAQEVDVSKLLQAPTLPLAIRLDLDRAVTRGGVLTLSWNDDLLHDLGIDRVGAVRGKV